MMMDHDVESVDEFEPRLEAPVHVTDGGSTGTRATAVDEAATATRISGATAAEQDTALHAAGNGRRHRTRAAAARPAGAGERGRHAPMAASAMLEGVERTGPHYNVLSKLAMA